MNPPMFGSWSVEVKEVRPFTIHGDQYFELHVVRLDDREQNLLSLKVAEHSAKGVIPKAGDHLMVSFLAGQVTSIKAVI